MSIDDECMPRIKLPLDERLRIAGDALNSLSIFDLAYTTVAQKYRELAEESLEEQMYED
jgi:hypothetical protein